MSLFILLAIPLAHDYLNYDHVSAARTLQHISRVPSRSGGMHPQRASCGSAPAEPTPRRSRAGLAGRSSLAGAWVSRVPGPARAWSAARAQARHRASLAVPGTTPSVRAIGVCVSTFRSQVSCACDEDSSSTRVWQVPNTIRSLMLRRAFQYCGSLNFLLSSRATLWLVFVFREPPFPNIMNSIRVFARPAVCWQFPVEHSDTRPSRRVGPVDGRLGFLRTIPEPRCVV